MHRNHLTPWPAEAVRLLREMWAGGLSASQIEHAFVVRRIADGNGHPFRPSRNAVIGKAQRDPYCAARPSPIKRAQ